MLWAIIDFILRGVIVYYPVRLVVEVVAFNSRGTHDFSSLANFGEKLVHGRNCQRKGEEHSSEHAVVNSNCDERVRLLPPPRGNICYMR